MQRPPQASETMAHQLQSLQHYGIVVVEAAAEDAAPGAFHMPALCTVLASQAICAWGGWQLDRRVVGTLVWSAHTCNPGQNAYTGDQGSEWEV